MQYDGLYLAAVAAYLPERMTADAAIEAGLFDPAVAAETGITAVSTAGDRPAPDLAVTAGRMALERGRVDPACIDAVFYASTWHQGPDGWSPQYYVVAELFGRDMPAFEVRQGCNGGLAAVDLAACYLLASPERTHVLIVTADNFSTPLVHRWSASQSFVLGDGATAVILSKQPGFARVRAVTLTSLTAAEELDRSGQQLFPPPITVGSELNFEARLDHYLAAWAGQMPPLVTLLPGALTGAVEQTLAAAGLDVTDVARICTINAKTSWLDYVLFKPLGLPTEIGTWDFGSGVGHVGAGDHLAALDNLVSTGTVRPGEHVLLVGTAPGHAIACAVVEILDQQSATGKA